MEEPGQAKRSQDVEEADHAKLTEITEEIRGPKMSSQKVFPFYEAFIHIYKNKKVPGEIGDGSGWP